MILSESVAHRTSLEGARVLAVDDDPGVLAMVMSMLRAQGCQPVGASSAEEAWRLIEDSPMDAVLLDVHLPGMNGHEFLRMLRADPRFALLPVVIVTGSVSREDRLLAASAGVSVYMVKPFDAMELSLRLSNLLDHKRIVDSLEEGARVMVMMARTIEARDKYTAGHSERVAKFAADMGRELQLSPREILTLEQGGLVHDIGKVGIRDNLLLKPGALTTEERLEFQLHPGIGVRMIESLRTQSHLLPVIHHHHERMDGSGYPDHLSGDGIPLLARITAYADVFDAVSSLRPYRPAYSVRDSMEIVRHEASRRLLDPELLSVFETVVARIGDAPVGLL